MIWAVAIWLAALIALALSWRVPHGRGWVLLAVAGFSVPLFVDRGGLLPVHLFMLNILVDVVICMIIDRYATQEWEAGLMRLYRASIHISLAGLSFYCVLWFAQEQDGLTVASSVTPSTLTGYLMEFYVILMEVVTYSALALIGREGWPEVMNGWRSLHHYRPDGRASARAVTRAPRQTTSWQRRP